MKNSFEGKGQVDYRDSKTGKSVGVNKLPNGYRSVVSPENGGKGTDWLQWALAGGGGILAYNLASSIMGDVAEKKKKSAWEKLLGVLIPLGVGGLGAAGGYALGGRLGTKHASAEKKAQTNEVQKAYGKFQLPIDGEFHDVANHDPKFNNKWYELIATRAREDGISVADAARKIIDENRGSASAWNTAGVASGAVAAGTGVAAGLKAREARLNAREADLMKKNPMYPTQTEIGAHRNAVKKLTDRIAASTTSPADAALSGQRLSAVRQAFAPKQELINANGAAMAKSRASRAMAGKLGWLSLLPAAFSVGSLAKGWYDSGDADQFSEANHRMDESFKKMVP